MQWRVELGMMASVVSDDPRVLVVCFRSAQRQRGRNECSE
jgi:hypothetical protein